MPLNTTGAPNTGDYQLGRGRCLMAVLENGLPDADGYRHLGNAPEFSITPEVETLEHQSSIEGTRKVDLEVPLSQKFTVTFVLDELNFQNLAEFFQGEAVAAPAFTNPAIAGFAAVVLTTAAKLGNWYDIVDSNGVRCYDIASANVTAREAGTPTVLVLGTDYELDLKQGLIRLLPGATGIADGETLDVALAADAGAVNVNEVRGLTVTSRRVAIKFIGVNPVNNTEREHQLHQVSLKPDGDFALIGDEFTRMGFTGVLESNTTADADSPYITIRDHANS